MVTGKSYIAKLLYKYFCDKCSQEELKTVYRWLNNSGNEKVFNDILDTYLKDQNLREPNQFTRIVSWHSIQNKIARDEESVLGFNNTTRWPKIRHLAAVVTIIAISSFIYLAIDKNRIVPVITSEAKAAIIRQTEKGQKLKFALPDGSLVTLNSASRLEIPADFMKDNARTVYLEGEAFFEVENVANQPFIVNSGGLVTTVLGTSFNVEANWYEDVKVAVLTGKVQVAGNDINVELEPNQMAIYKAHEGILKTKYDAVVELGWKDGILVFHQDDFESMIRKLELWYGVEITIRGIPPKDSFSARYNNVSLEIIMEGLSFSGDFNYRIEDKLLIMDFK